MHSMNEKVFARHMGGRDMTLMTRDRFLIWFVQGVLVEAAVLGEVVSA